MQKIFSNIEEFIKIKRSCVFCDRELKCVLTTFDLGLRSLPVINAPLKNDKFNFTINHTNALWEISTQTVIDIKKNLITFQISDSSSEQIKVDTTAFLLNHTMVKFMFEGFKPHIELYCSSRKCNMKYTFFSDVLVCDEIAGNLLSFEIKPFPAYMESFEIDKLWIQNNWIHNYLKIFSKTNVDVIPIKHPNILNLQELGKEKVTNKIRTLVTFS